MSSPFTQARAGVTVNPAPFWQDVKARLSTAEALRILQNDRPDLHPLGRVYLAHEDYSRPVGATGARWGRLEVVPTTTLWPAAETEPGYRGLGWLVRSVANVEAGSDPGTMLNRLQTIAWEQLNGWAPKNQPKGYMAVRPIWRQRGPQPMPEWDPDRKLWWLSSEFRAEITRI